MKQYLVSDLHQQWLESGKQPVVFFSSQVPFESPEIVTPVHTPQSVSSSQPVETIDTPAQAEGKEVTPPQLELDPALELEPEPTQPPWELPTLALPALPSLPSLPRFQVSAPSLPPLPRFRIHSVTLPNWWPRLQLPQLAIPTRADFENWKRSRTVSWQRLGAQLSDWPWKRILTWGSRLAYGSALAALVLFLTPIVVLESQSAWHRWQSRLADMRLHSQGEQVPPTPSPTPEPEINGVEDYFWVEIPRLKVASRIIPNVDAGSAAEYEPALKLGVAHALGSGLPDDTSLNKTIYLFAHSTNAAFNIQRYNAQFYALKDTVAGDQIKVRYWGQDYWYTIQETKIVDADDVSFLEPQMEQERLILQTCYPPGTTWKRLVVIATPTLIGEGDTSRAE